MEYLFDKFFSLVMVVPLFESLCTWNVFLIFVTMEHANDLTLMWPYLMVCFSHFVGLLLAMLRRLPSHMPAIFNCSRVVTSVNCCAVCSKSKCTAGLNKPLIGACWNFVETWNCSVKNLCCKLLFVCHRLIFVNSNSENWPIFWASNTCVETCASLCISQLDLVL